MRMISSLRKFLVCIISAALVVLAIFYYIAGTESGLQLVWSKVKRRLPDNLHVESLHGNLISSLTIQNITYQDETALVSIQSIHLSWDAWRLLRKRFVITDIDIDGLSVKVKQSQEPAPSKPSTFKIDDLLKWLRYLRVERANIHHAEVDYKDVRIVLDGGLDDNWHLQWSIKAPELNHLATDVRGKLTTTGSIIGSRLQPDMQINIQLDNFATKYFGIRSLGGSINSSYSKNFTDHGVINVKGLNIEGMRVPDLVLKTASQLKKGAYQLNVSAVLSPVNVIDAELKLPKFLSNMTIDQPFKASASVDVKDFSQFNTLFADIPQVRSVAGQVTGTFNASGTLLHPVIDGGLQVTNGSVFVPPASMEFSDIRMQARYHTGKPINLRATFVAGQGSASIEGTYGVEEPALPLLIRVKGTDVLVYDTKEYKIKISPDMLLSYQNNDLDLSGKIEIPYALIAPVDFSTTTTLSSDVVIVNKKTTSSDVPTNVSLQIQLVLGSNVNLQYHDLKTKLHGGINIYGKPGRPLTATGEFNINDGTYKAYGRTLNIQQGRLIYAGNLLSNPGISLRASQTIKTAGSGGGSQFDSSDFQSVYTGSGALTVGVAVSGVIDKPRITLFSDRPGLSQGDILSYLLFGYPQSQASGASGLALLGVAGQMYGGDSGGGSPTESLQNKLGLDELSVGTTEYFDASSTAQGGAPTTASATTVNMGRNLGHNLSLHYSVGLFQQVQVFSIRYQISRHFAIQTETSTLENGGDLLYQLESAH